MVKATLRSLLWFALIAIVVWAWTLWQWDRTQRVVSQADIVLQLLALPLALFLGFLLLRWGWRASGRAAGAQGSRGRADPGAGLSAAAPATAGSAAAPGGATPSPLQQTTCLLLAQAVHTAAGSDAAELPDQLRTSPLRPAPDALLRDDEDLAPFSTRVASLNDTALRDMADALGLGTGADMSSNAAAAALDHDPAQLRLLRCLALVQPCCALLQVADAELSAWLRRLPAPQATHQTAVVPTELLAARRSAGPSARLGLQQAALLPQAPAFEVWLMLPAVPAPALALAQRWLAQQLGALAAFEPRVHQLVVRTASDGVAPLSQAQQRVLEWQRAGRSGLLLLLLADSLLSADLALRLSREQLVINGQRNRGLTLGEAAVGLLLGTLDARPPAASTRPSEPPAHPVASASPSAGPEDDDKFDTWDGLDGEPSPHLLDPPLYLHRIGLRLRDKSADAGGRIGADVAQAVLDDALAAASSTGPIAERVTQLVSDADLRASRSTELYGAVLTHVPQLDAGHDIHCLGINLGDCGIASAGLALACAAASLSSPADAPPADRAAAGATSWLSVSHAQARGAGLLSALPSTPH